MLRNEKCSLPISDHTVEICLQTWIPMRSTGNMLVLYILITLYLTSPTTNLPPTLCLLEICAPSHFGSPHHAYQWQVAWMRLATHNWELVLWGLTTMSSTPPQKRSFKKALQHHLDWARDTIFSHPPSLSGTSTANASNGTPDVVRGQYSWFYLINSSPLFSAFFCSPCDWSCQ